MKTETFKSMLVENKESLRGRTLSIFLGIDDYSEDFTTLKEFGERILELEIQEYEFSFEESLTKVRAKYVEYIPELTHAQRCRGIKEFGTAA